MVTVRARATHLAGTARRLRRGARREERAAGVEVRAEVCVEVVTDAHDVSRGLLRGAARRGESGWWQGRQVASVVPERDDVRAALRQAVHLGAAEVELEAALLLFLARAREQDCVLRPPTALARALLLRPRLVEHLLERRRGRNRRRRGAEVRASNARAVASGARPRRKHLDARRDAVADALGHGDAARAVLELHRPGGVRADNALDEQPPRRPVTRRVASVLRLSAERSTPRVLGAQLERGGAAARGRPRPRRAPPQPLPPPPPPPSGGQASPTVVRSADFTASHSASKTRDLGVEVDLDDVDRRRDVTQARGLYGIGDPLRLVAEGTAAKLREEDGHAAALGGNQRADRASHTLPRAPRARTAPSPGRWCSGYRRRACGGVHLHTRCAPSVSTSVSHCTATRSASIARSLGFGSSATSDRRAPCCSCRPHRFRGRASRSHEHAPQRGPAPVPEHLADLGGQIELPLPAALSFAAHEVVAGSAGHASAHAGPCVRSLAGGDAVLRRDRRSTISSALNCDAAWNTAPALAGSRCSAATRRAPRCGCEGRRGGRRLHRAPRAARSLRRSAWRRGRHKAPRLTVILRTRPAHEHRPRRLPHPPRSPARTRVASRRTRPRGSDARTGGGR